ncbi:MAG: hypothetical protein KDC53_13015 [Saprospiraceae bacterium]|nr:hypothetical protein [Saprospiraceae bacterium]
MQYHFFIDLLGWIGSLELLAAYFLVSSNRLLPNTGLYQWLNLSGSVFLLINTMYYGAFPSSFLNAVWGIVAILALFRLAKPKVNY